MKTIGLIFPHQLFDQHPILKEQCDEIYLIEDSLFFGDKHTQLQFHKQKLVFHRASMRSYFDTLKDSYSNIHYIEHDSTKTIGNILDELQADNIICIDPTDYLLERRLRRRSENLTLLSTPLFINTKEKNNQWHNDNPKYFMQEFYKHQRRRLNILVTESGQPIGGKWSFDEENRKKIPKTEIPEIPKEPLDNTNDYVIEARAYINAKFPDNYGSMESFWYPIDHTSAQSWFQEFLEIRFEKFGVYEDAMVNEHSMLYHSVLSPLLNVGLLDPLDVVQQAINHAEKNDIPLNSLEGFVRQIIGWREYIRMLYEHEGVTMRTNNQWEHTRDLDTSYWSGETGIYPIDESITRILKTGYAHHIERLMLHGNFLFLNEIKPDDTYRWFMEMFIDSYDWVMVPNVYGMTQNTSHGLMTTKPYISGSNYVTKMSNYKKEPWTKIWDGLYWSFIIKHLDYLTKNGRMFFVTNRAAKFTNQQKQEYEDIRETYFSTPKDNLFSK